ncbi:VOC family protein [Rhizobium sp. YJ-22]|uniref:VOC family protein n=1 Tax=Rhizobium sp. YJ-22 TaxID=3037556 RepID=UPI002412D1A3|nr:VOC family protein [Rhizobium sp. YJ-22]MDG3574910.1 VOC family protein [Rhizobium sp. YJ-22]
MGDMQGKFVWYELMTTDIPAAARFYNSVVGWNARDAGMGLESPYWLLEMPGQKQATGGLQALPEDMKAMRVPPNWTGYVAVDDVDATAEKCVELGGTIRRPPDDIPGIGRFAVLADPQGPVIIAFKPAPMDGDMPPEPAMGTPGFVGWCELYAKDVDKAFDYYRQLFGWEKIDEMDMGPKGKYLLFGRDGQMTGGMMRQEEDGPFCGWSYYFAVDTLDAALDRVKAGGGRVLEGPMEVPGAWVLQAQDPQGAYFCLVAPVR